MGFNADCSLIKYCLWIVIACVIYLFCAQATVFTHPQFLDELAETLCHLALVGIREENVGTHWQQYFPLFCFEPGTIPSVWEQDHSSFQGSAVKPGNKSSKYLQLMGFVRLN